ATANSAVVKNSCTYPIHILPVAPGTTPKSEIIQPGQTFTRPLHISPKCIPGHPNALCGGVSLKVSRHPNDNNVIQFEYTAVDGLVWYNLSLIVCIKKPGGCVGHEGGYKAVAAQAQGCREFKCGPSETCDTEAYFIEEYGYQDGAPVGACRLDGGVAFEVCAG
ncbi:hypothetical protein M011DRAFT_377617, partial [Sporormia fimetaria CBS 119925]